MVNFKVFSVLKFIRFFPIKGNRCLFCHGRRVSFPIHHVNLVLLNIRFIPVFFLFSVVFGQLIDTFGEWETRMLVPEPQRITESQFMDKIIVATLFFIYLGIGTFVATYIYMGIFISSGERTTYRIRKAYLKGNQVIVD